MNMETKNKLERFYRKNVWEPVTLGGALTLWSQRYGENVAVTENGRQLTYGQLETEAGSVAQGFLSSGFKRGDKIVLQIPNSMEFVIAIFALFKAGMIPVMALPAQRKTEIKGILEKSDARGYIIKDRYLGFDYKEMAREILSESCNGVRVIVLGENEEFTSFGELRADCVFSEAEAADSADIGLFLLSGGTTGIPKLIPRRHADYLYVAKETAGRCKLTSNSVYLAALPIAHNFPLGCPGLMGTLTAGGRIVICSVTSPDEIIPLIEEEKVTITGLVPAMASMCIEFLELGEEYDLSSLEVIQVGGSVLDPYLAQRVEKAFNCRLQQIFGIAEGLICCTDLKGSDYVRYHTQGKPISPYDEVLIVDEKGEEVPEGEYGELLVRGAYTIYGYYNLEEVNKDRISEECYFKTGDRARRLKDGNYQVAGRLTEMINRAGEKIIPSEIEELLLKNELISEVQVVGIKDKLLGEKICAFILEGSEKMSLNNIRNCLADMEVAAFKLPDQVAYISNWPLTSVGKIDRNKLRELGEKL
ncbi:2,3-dihydroxybenzoate-AMP ligase [Ruminiclostridium hungatei]|uniref:2,3-dihydroxybenzoate-AMP ligase n=1 Tax=Ruminiclostridium hungatei TaxID=48256 RepID=A0A1V4SM43_RUMHU|nr:AMP-binding protein [Ruminiclostridium hungatei]OPX44930.1 2,3-dihydroxybenzoate-AMP ligase [Ruminiclostridium hungatei]